MWWKRLAGLVLLCSPLLAQETDRTEIVVPPSCITKIEIGPNTWIHGPDFDHLTVERLVLTYKKACETVPAKKTNLLHGPD
jgi:hypothetical protein